MNDNMDPQKENHNKDQIKTDASKSGWGPILHHPIYRALWIATVISNIGSSMHDTGSMWLMTSLADSAFLVALIPAAASLAIVVMALPGGAFGDVLNRNKLLIISQGYMVGIASTLAFATLFSIITPLLLILLTFALGLGAALSMPLLIRLSLEMVSKEESQSTITLSGVAINIGRAVGPTVGGFIIALSGPWAVFLINALTFISIIFVLKRWSNKDRRQEQNTSLPPEHVIGAIRAGIRYLKHSPDVQSVLIRATTFTIFGSALFALLPSLVKNNLGFGSSEYGLFLGALGIGAIIGGTLILPKIRQIISIDWLVVVASILFAITVILLSHLDNFFQIFVVMIGSGIAWIILLSCFNFSAFKAGNKWVANRLLSIYLAVFQGGIAVGSLLWGQVAIYTDVRTALVLSSIGLIIGLLSFTKYRLIKNGEVDKTSYAHWPIPNVIFESGTERKPVMIEIRYKIDPINKKEFETIMKEWSRIRKRDGAIHWGLYYNGEKPNEYVETFISESWEEHLRQHERFTIADIEIENKVRSFHIDKDPPIVTHFLARSL